MHSIKGVFKSYFTMPSIYIYILFTLYPCKLSMLHTFRYEFVIKLFELTIKYWKCNDVTLLTWQWVQDQDL